MVLTAAAPAHTESPVSPQPVFPSAILWSVEIGRQPLGPPVLAGNRVVVALRDGLVSARAIADGSEVWSAALAATAELAAGTRVVLVPIDGAVEALDIETGRRKWLFETPQLTAAALALGGWVILAAGEQLTALRESDGTPVWTRRIAPIEEQPAIEGDAVFVAVADGRVIALDLQTGAPIWQYATGSKPTAPFVYGDRVYFGADDFFWCLHRDSGGWDWSARIGAAVRGRAAGDERAIYVAAMDNLLRAYNRRHGAREWQEDLGYRPSGGPMVIGSMVAVPGPVPTVRIFDTRTRRAGPQLTLPDPAVASPAFSRSGPPLLAVVTNDLGRPWLLTLAGEPSPALPAPVALSAPPVPALPLPVLPGR